MIDAFIYTLANGFHSLIDGRNFLTTKRLSIAVAQQQCRDHVVKLIHQQDGGTIQNRSLAQRKNLYHATATP